MTNRLMRLMGTTALAASIFASGSAFALENYGDWDKDANATITNEEFGAGLKEQGVFEDWDTDNDNMLSQTEFDAGLGDNEDAFSERYGDNADYGIWDANSDNALSEDEFYDGAFAGYDSDEDNVIEEPEFGDLGDDIGDGGFWDV